MKLNEVLANLKDMKLVCDNNKIRIFIQDGKSLKKDDTILTCDILTKYAEKMFGEMEILINRVGVRTEYNVGMFEFLLVYEDDGEKVSEE